MTNRTPRRTPQDAGLRAFAACAAQWGSDVNGQMLKRALTVSILAVHHGLDPVKAMRMVENDEPSQDLDAAYAERTLLLEDAQALVDSARWSTYEQPEPALGGAA